jgi:hypothetical protein
MQGSHHRANSDSCKLNRNGLLLYCPAPTWPGFIFIELHAAFSTLCVFAPIYLGLDARELRRVLSVFQNHSAEACAAWIARSWLALATVMSNLSLDEAHPAPWILWPRCFSRTGGWIGG